MGVHWKFQFLGEGEGGFTKNQYIAIYSGELPKKGEGFDSL